MEVLTMLLAAHFIGDWIVQTDKQALGKMHSWREMAGHVLGYHLVMVFFLCLGANYLSTVAILTILFVSAVTHGFIDRRWPVRWLMRHTGSPNFAKVEWGVIATDQALHLTILVLLARMFG